MRHEFLHCLGILTSDPVFKDLVQGSSFVGANAKAANHDSAVPLSGPGEAHVGFSLPSVMNPSNDDGIRRDLSSVEWGILKDLGWSIVNPPGFYTKYDLLTNGADGTVNLLVVPSRGLYLMRLDALTGDVITITTSDGSGSGQTGVDTYLRLFDSNGKVVAFDDDGAGARKSRIQYTAIKGGTFYVGAGTYSQRDYTFTTPPSVTPPSTAFKLSATIPTRVDKEPDLIADVKSSIAFGVTTSAALIGDLDIDYFRFDAVTGRTYTVATSFPGAGGLPGAAILSIYDATGHKVTGMTAAPAGSEEGAYYGSASFKASESGSYFVAVQCFVGSATVELSGGTLGGSWAFISSADGYNGSGENENGSNYALTVRESKPNGGGSNSNGGGSNSGVPSPVVLGVSTVVHFKHTRKVASVTLRFSSEIAASSAAQLGHFALACAVKKRGKLTFSGGWPSPRRHGVLHPTSS